MVFNWSSDGVVPKVFTLPSSIKQIDAEAFYGLKDITINCPWAEGAIANAPWGAENATINYNYTESSN